MFKISAVTLLMFVSFVAHAADIEADQVTLRGVDKITGRINTMQVAVGESIEFGKLSIVVNKCLTKPIEEAPENTAFLTIVEKKNPEEVKPVFNGWMFSSNPALSAMEHPVYDVWVISCTKTQEDVIPLEGAVESNVSDQQAIQMENLPDETQPETPILTEPTLDLSHLSNIIEIKELE